MSDLLTLAEMMSRHTVGVTPGCSLAEAAACMVKLKISSLLVTEAVGDENRLCGIVTERDLLHALRARTAPETPVARIMSTPVLTASHALHYGDAYRLAIDNGVRHLVVVDDDGEPVGIVTQTDFRQRLGLNIFLQPRPVVTLMNPVLPVLPPLASLEDALEMMETQRASAVVIATDRRPLGILTERDAVRLYIAGNNANATPLQAIMSQPPLTIGMHESLSQAAARMLSARVRHLVVIDGEGLLCGLLAEQDLVRPIGLTTFDDATLATQNAEQRWIAALEIAGHGVWDWNLLSGRHYVSPAWLEHLGYDAKTFADRHESWLDLVHPEEAASNRSAIDAHCAGATPTYSRHVRLRTGDGQWRWAQVQGSVYTRAVDGRAMRLVGTFNDVTERRRIDEQHRRARNNLDAVFAALGDLVFVLDADGRVLHVNPAVTQLLGHEAEAVIGRPMLDFHPAALRDQAQASLASLFAGATDNHAIPLRTHDGNEIAVETRASHGRWDNRPALIVVSRDIRARIAAEERQRLAASVFENAHEGIMITGPDGTIMDVNDAFTDLTGYHRSDVVGKKPNLLKSGHQAPEFYVTMWQVLQQDGYWRGELWNRHKDGQFFAELLTITAVKSPDGRISHFVGIFSDITQAKQHQQRLEYLAHYDPLTQLPNRTLLADRMQQALAHTRRSGDLLAVCYLDLDGFKPINDTWGHEAGDQLLLEISRRLKTALRGGDTVARLGGDEFVLLLGDLASIEEAEEVLSRLLEFIATPQHIANEPVTISASIGFTLYPLDPADPDTLLRNADQAMYAAKQAGRNRYHLFDTEHDRRIRSRREAYTRIEAALAANEFRLYYQPKVNMRSGKIIGAEALIRWQHPERGIVSPGEFLPVIENSDLDIAIGQWVIAQALRQMEAWQADGFSIPISVNISAHHLQDPDFTQQIASQLQDHAGIMPDRLEFEVLENAALQDMARVSRVIDECRALGIAFSLDDFGTGYSSLTYFRRLPADTLKIDQSFVRDMLDDADDLAIVEGVIGLTRAFGRTVIAEGVETAEHGLALLQLGCDLAQGYGIARPMPAADLPRWAANFRPDPLWETTIGFNWHPDDLPLLMAEFEHRRWVAEVTATITSCQPATAPDTDNRSCRFGKWYEQQGIQRYGKLTGFAALGEIHDQTHACAASLVALLTAGQHAEATAGLPGFHALRDRLLERLHALRTDASMRA